MLCVVCLSVHSDAGSGGRWPAGRLDGGEDRQEAQSDVLLAAIRLRFHHHHRSTERVDALRRQSAHRPRQRGHVIGRPGTGLTPFFQFGSVSHVPALTPVCPHVVMTWLFFFLFSSCFPLFIL